MEQEPVTLASLIAKTERLEKRLEFAGCLPGGCERVREDYARISPCEMTEGQFRSIR